MVNHSFEFFKAGLGKIEKIHSKDQYGLFCFFLSLTSPSVYYLFLKETHENQS